MSKFSEKLGSGKPKEKPNNWQEIEIGIDCSCGDDQEQVWYDKSSKKVKTLCIEGHEDIIEMDLSWLIR